jgi:DNA-binding transcriptional LysR family regulator
MDVAVTARSATSRELVCEPLRPERIVAFVRTDHPLAHKRSVKIPELFNERFITRGGAGISGTTEKALKQFRTQGFEVKIGLRCDDPMAVRAAVRQKMGVGIGFEETIKADAQAGAFKILKVRGLELAGTSYIIYLKHHQLSPLAQECLELLRAARSQHIYKAPASADAPPKRSRHVLAHVA